MSNLKNSKEIEIMRRAGQITAKALEEVEKNIKIGVSTNKLDQAARAAIKNAGAESSFKKVSGYKYSICTTHNDRVVHGIQGNYYTKDGAIIGVDIESEFMCSNTEREHQYTGGK